MLLNVILNKNDLYQNNPVSELLPVSDDDDDDDDVDEHGVYNKMDHK